MSVSLYYIRNWENCEKRPLFTLLPRHHFSGFFRIPFSTKIEEFYRGAIEGYKDPYRGISIEGSL